MSFFGFETALPRDAGRKPGFGATPDAFAGLAGRAGAGGDALEFEETYDGLGDQLDETDDALNDDTFGGEPATQQSIGRDFDFSGQTAQVSNAIQEEQMLFTARQPPPKASPVKQPAKPARTGYEKYTEPGYIPSLEANASIWGPAASKSTPEPAPQRGGSRKMMSLEEVEAAMRSDPRGPTAAPPEQPPSQQVPFPGAVQPPGFAGPPQILQRPQAQQQHVQPPPQQAPSPDVPPPQQQPQILQRRRQPQPGPGFQGPQQQPRHAPVQPIHPIQGHPQQPHAQPRQILQNPNRLSGQGQPIAPPPGSRPEQWQRVPTGPAGPPAGPTGPSHRRGASYQGPVITHPQQLLNLTDEERAAIIEEDARRAKRNHKIHLLSKDNGLMTPQDKNFITRIQLQQLVTATGGTDEKAPEAALNEDFYYQVFSQIRGAARQNPHQPANQFAQTYLFQTGGRYGMRGRHPRGGDNHIQRMEQQVQRAVEAAKAKPKNKQLVIEGSLGKISFSNAKTPKPLLNIKRPESTDGRPASAQRNSRLTLNMNDRKNALRDIENVYNTLMQMEDHERNMPPQISEESDAASIQIHLEWRQQIQALNEKLWKQLKVMEPIVPNSPTPHPFVSILSHPKGKKAIPRIFRHIDEQQRITILTMIVVNLDNLDVIRLAVPEGSSSPTIPPPATREAIDLFSHFVMPSLFAHVNEAPLPIVIGLLGLVLDRCNMPAILRTKVGLSVLTMLISRAELVKEASAGGLDPADWEQWTQLYNRLFDTAEPVLPYLFPGSVNDSEDVYVWQFLAAMGVGANPEQQQRLVIGVKERVMETVERSRSLPADLREVRLGHVNLFMRAIGLDVELLG